ncbi:B3 domain-containing protein LOC_Os12g40090-like [Lolium rigidum]|uniref:B3 domain-containing protein LOC_Os12g40090-like n=1 Tax=Lolium rigidum TaxID=89674 RepID=UPI001F5E0618|nr:B3 domain-containing protein LOC_Os12g40090-like [Lolium rigidum]
MAAEGESMGEKGRCVRCREWQEHYYWEHMDVSNIKFFKIMTADYQQRISIPENIANKFTEQIAKGAFTLKAPSGDTWCVDVGKIAGELFFMSGWEEFAKAQGLQENDLLFFKCSDSGSFDVLIFDSSGSEKVPCFFTDKERAKMLKQFDDIVAQEAEVHGLLSDAGNAIMRLSQPVGSPHTTSTSEKPGEENESPNNRDPQVKCGVTEEEEQSDDEQNDSSDYYYYSRFASYLTVDEREQIFGLASIQQGNPVYVVVLQKSHVRRSNNILVIPSKFATDHLARKSHDILLLKPNRKEQWYVKYYYHAKVTRGINGVRWAKFVRDNRLREGDICIFELMKGIRKVTMTVHVTRKVDDGRFVLLA